MAFCVDPRTTVPLVPDIITMSRSRRRTRDEGEELALEAEEELEEFRAEMSVARSAKRKANKREK